MNMKIFFTSSSQIKENFLHILLHMKNAFVKREIYIFDKFKNYYM